jgi:nucleotide-binding universal stress UspA family protein
MKTILVPIDFSGNSKNAMDYAILLAKKLKMQLLLLHASRASVAEAISDSYKIAAHKQISGTPAELKSELSIWAEALTGSEKGLKCETVFAEGDLTDVITELMEERDIELIVMGTKGATGLKEVFMGSNTAKVIEESSCPVIAVPQGFQFNDIKKIIFATDYHDSDINSLRFMIKLALLFDSELIVTHVAEGDLKPRFEEDLLQYFIEKAGKSVAYNKMKFHLLDGQDTNKSLNKFIDDQKADLFVISTKDRLFKGPLFNRGLTKKFAHHIQIPLMVFHAFEFDENGFI